MYYIYMLLCQDNSIYTGITTDLKRRMKEHFEQDKNCAKYTLRHQAINLECAWQTETRKLASKLEYHIKTLPKSKKEELIKNEKLLKEFLSSKIDYEEYERIKKNDIKEIKDLESLVDEIDWTSAWVKKYPILVNYQKENGISNYQEQIAKIHKEIIEKYGFSEVDAFLVLKDMIYQEYLRIKKKI